MFHVCLYYIVLSVPCSIVFACWERVGLLALLCVMFLCSFVIFPYGVSGNNVGKVWNLIYRFLIFAFLFTFAMRTKLV